MQRAHGHVDFISIFRSGPAAELLPFLVCCSALQQLAGAAV